MPNYGNLKQQLFSVSSCSGQILTIIKITTRVWTPGGFVSLLADPAHIQA